MGMSAEHKKKTKKNEKRDEEHSIKKYLIIFRANEIIMVRLLS